MEDYKEKYEQAMFRMNKWVEGSEITDPKEVAEFVFPEFKEPEDERIRKELIKVFEEKVQHCFEWKNGIPNNAVIAWLEKQGEHANFMNKIQIGDEVTRNEDGALVNLSQFKRMVKQGKHKPIKWNSDDLLKRNQIMDILQEYNRPELISWLEKQGEQKPSDKVEPKFKVGDTIVEKDLDECGCGTIVNIKDGKYIFDDGWSVSIKEQELWQLVEQKPSDKVEPKFKVGDWIISSEGTLRHIVAVDKTGYETNEGWLTHDDYEKNFHLWTIQDAKYGDILASDKIVLIVDHIGDFEGESTIYSWYFADSNKFYGIGPKYPDKWSIEGFHPATQEQHDFLFAKMKEAGYEWDAEKKELKKIEQKPAWSEEDEKYFNVIYKELESYIAIKGYYTPLSCADLSWLKSLKDRVQSQPKQEWSEEDDKKRKGLIKGLEDRMGFGWASDPFSREEYIDWLKSLKPNHWKPSEEQLDALHDAAVYVDKSMFPYPKGILMKLYDQLKKLKGE